MLDLIFHLFLVSWHFRFHSPLRAFTSPSTMVVTHQLHWPLSRGVHLMFSNLSHYCSLHPQPIQSPNSLLCNVKLLSFVILFSSNARSPIWRSDCYSLCRCYMTCWVFDSTFLWTFFLIEKERVTWKIQKWAKIPNSLCGAIITYRNMMKRNIHQAQKIIPGLREMKRNGARLGMGKGWRKKKKQEVNHRKAGKCTIIST